MENMAYAKGWVGGAQGQPVLEIPFVRGQRASRAWMESHGIWKPSLLSGIYSYNWVKSSKEIG